MMMSCFCIQHVVLLCSLPFALLCNFVVLPVIAIVAAAVAAIVDAMVIAVVAGVAACGKAFVAVVAAGKNVYLFCLFLTFFYRSPKRECGYIVFTQIIMHGRGKYTLNYGVFGQDNISIRC